MEPFGIQIVFYLFLAGIAAGAGFMGSLALKSRKTVAFADGKRAIVLAIICALAGAAFLIFDLTRPSDFWLILASANASSAISWGARILVVFSLSAIFVWATVRRWGEPEIAGGFRGVDAIGLWLLRLASLGLAVYPAFVLRQGAAFPLWQNSLLLPLIAVSAFHSGVAAMLLLSKWVDCKRKARGLEIVLGAAQLLLLTGVLVVEGARPLTWGCVFAVGTLLPLLIVLIRPNSTLGMRVTLVLLGAFAFRYWLIAAGELV